MRAIVNLARNYPRKKNIRQVSIEEQIPRKYLEHLFAFLRDKKLIESTRGKKGGYFLSCDPEEIKVGRIIEALEGPISVRGCGLCRAEKKCSSSIVWLKLEREMKKTLNSINLSELI